MAPKLLYCPVKSMNLPVWEICTKEGRTIYYERIHYAGLIPVGIINTIQIGGTTIGVYKSVCTKQNKNPRILKAKDGYTAPSSWYRTDTKFIPNDGISVSSNDDIKMPDKYFSDSDD
jgi:hypothetical protein